MPRAKQPSKPAADAASSTPPPAPAPGADPVAPAAAPPADKPAKGKLAIKSRDDEACRREVFDVEYSVKGETVVDRGFLSREAAEAHAAMVREAYGL